MVDRAFQCAAKQPCGVARHSNGRKSRAERGTIFAGAVRKRKEE